MAEAPKTRPGMAVALYVTLALIVMAFRVMPTETLTRQIAAPELLLAGTIVVVLRRPAYVPVWVIAAVFLLADLLHQRPPGAYAAVVVIVTEVLRGQSVQLRSGPLITEAIAGVMGIIAALIGYRVLLMLFVIPRPSLALALTEIVTTVMVFPVLVLAGSLFLGLERAAPGAVDSMGRRL